MKIPCPVCATVIKAEEEHSGLKNRCVTCGTKFIIPSCEDAEVEILEHGEAPQSTVTRLQVRPPKTAPLLKPGKHRPLPNPRSGKRPQGPRKLLTSSDPLGAPTGPPAARVFQSLPSVPPPRTTGEKTDPAPEVPARKKLASREITGKKTTKKHSLEHLPALAPDPEPPEENLPQESPPAAGDQTDPPDTTALLGKPRNTHADVATEVPPGPAPETPPEENPGPDGTSLPPTTKLAGTPGVKNPSRAKPRPPSTDPEAAPPHKRSREEEEEGTGPTPSLRTGTDRPLPDRSRHGSFHDLKVKRTQKDARGIVQAIVVLSICAIVALLFFSGMGREDTGSQATNPALVPDRESGPGSGAKIPSTESEPMPRSEQDTEVTGLGQHWEDLISPWIEHYCLDCHDEANEEGGLELERFTSEKLALTEPHIWEKAAQLVKMGDMPPRDRFNLPSSEERAQFVTWVRSVSERWDAGEFGKDPGRTTIRRMTKNEYNYTMRDLFGLKIRPADNFPEDGGGEDGFDNNADALFLPPLLMENYVEAAGLLVNEIYRNQDSFRRWLFAFPHNEGGAPAAARTVLNHWMPLIYRRPVDSQEVERLVSILRFQMDKKKKEYREAMKMPLLAILISPHFLYRSEKILEGGKPYRVNDIDLASRLSYFLWSSTPDQQLLKLAFEGKLSDPQVYEEQVRRMLVDDKARSLGMHFGGQWLKWEDLRSRANPDRKRFPNFDFALRVSMYRESSLFFDNLVRENLSILDLIDSDYSFLNQKLAIHYDIPGVNHSTFQKVKIDDPNRGGVIGMGSVLTATSLPLRSSPAKRGNYLLTELLGTRPLPPRWTFRNSPRTMRRSSSSPSVTPSPSTAKIPAVNPAMRPLIRWDLAWRTTMPLGAGVSSRTINPWIPAASCPMERVSTVPANSRPSS